MNSNLPTGPSRWISDDKLESMLTDFIRLGNRLDREAKRRYGNKGFLFHEADGSVYIMDGDTETDGGSLSDRQKHIKFSAHGTRWGAGAW